MSQSTNPPAPSGGAGRQSGPRKASSGPTGSPRTGRRQTRRRHHEQPPSTFQRYRTPLVVVVVVAVLFGVGALVFTAASTPAYACTTVDTPQAAADGEIGQVQPDMGNAHVNAGDRVTYPVCPPASGKHVNRTGYGPLQPKVYGPEDDSVPNGWVHNLEHGGLVLLYSCDKGACSDADLQALQDFSAGFPNSAVCGIPAGIVGPVIARFEQMPTRYAALVWDRAYYFDQLDAQSVYDFYLRYGERLADDGSWIAPPEPQCVAPSPSPSGDAGASAEPSPAAS